MTEFFLVFYFGIAVLLVVGFATPAQWRVPCLGTFSVLLTVVHVWTIHRDSIDPLGLSEDLLIAASIFLSSYGLAAFTAVTLLKRKKSVFVTTLLTFGVATLVFVATTLVSALYVCGTRGCM